MDYSPPTRPGKVGCAMVRAYGAASLGLAAAAFAFAAAAVPEQQGELDQGWTQADRTAWYGASQGSRLIPLDWLLALEQPGGEGLFLDDAYIRSFGYIPRQSYGGRLPLGFAVDVQDDRNLVETKLRWRAGQRNDAPWVGMNCSACHTAELSHGGGRYVIDGGPTLADFQGFMEALNAAVAETTSEPRFSRFARRVLPVNDAGNRARLLAALRRHIAFEETHARMNATSSRYGPGRLDAVGHIFNKVALLANRQAPTANEPNAPVSYPFLWNITQHEAVQWNGVAPNFPLPGRQPFDPGALVRNTSEVIGVFADVNTSPRRGLSRNPGYPSSVNVDNLVSMDQLLTRLSAPRWPAAIPVDPERVRAGRALFAAKCSGCHQVLKARTDTTSGIPLDMSLFNPQPPLRGEKNPPNPRADTDPAMACNAALSVADAGVMAGRPKGYVGKGERIGAHASLVDLLVTSSGGVLWNRRGEAIRAGIRSVMGRQPPPRVVQPPRVGGVEATAEDPRIERCRTAVGKTLGYKARPLNGVWATAPYLHNGSVPTLHDLLLPPAQRPKVFYVGSREFNPREVGFTTEPGPGRFRFDTALPGNSNAGHDYGNAALTAAERLAVVEYMKTFAEP